MALAYTVDVSRAAFAAMSIDLGNQFIKIGIVKPGVPMEIVLNKDSRRKTPFVIGIKDGERFFGDAALQFGIKAPTYTFYSFLDLIGKQIDHPIVEKYKKENPHLTLVADEARGTVVFKTDQYEYPVEILLSMILWNIGVQCEAYAGQLVKDVVITAPAYFNHAERKAIANAAEIAGFNLLQLLTEGAAAGLNYGVFRRKFITEEPKTLLIYDIGHSKTIATVVEYRLVKEKNTKEMNPVISTLGLGYNRTLGGGELTRRLRQYLLEQFVNNYKPKGDITKNPRALAKLQKEAERVKLVLSANNDHVAKIEGLFENKDFRLKVPREQFQALFADIESDFFQPIIGALKMAELEAENIDLVVLMGAGTRVPRLQQLFQNYFKNKEVGRFLNTDEAIAMGLVYQAAHLSKGFKVKRFDVQELQIYPVQVSFTSGSTSTAEQPSLLHRTLYGYKTNYPAVKKVISITSHTNDFSINLNYGPLNHLSEQELLYFGSRNITEVAIKGLEDILKKEVTDESATFKGVKIHFKMDHTGIVETVKAEAVIERIEKSNSTFSTIVDKIGEFFSDSNSLPELDKSDDQNESGEQNRPDEGSGDSANNTSNSTDSNLNASDDSDSSASFNETNESTGSNDKEKNDENKTETSNELNAEKKEQRTEVKPKVLKVPLILEPKDAFPLMNAEDRAAAVKILSDFEKKEKEKEERDYALNSLESAVYELSSKVEEDDFTMYGTVEELDALRSSITALKTWLDEEVGIENTKDEFVTKKNELNTLAKKIRYRKQQAEQRVVLINTLEGSLSNISIEAIKENAPPSTEESISSLEKVLIETKEWLEQKKNAQSELADNQDPVLLASEVDDKIKNLQREFQYLLRNLQYAKLKEEKAKKVKEEEEAAKKEKESKSTDDNKEKPSAEENNEESENASESDLPIKTDSESLKNTENTATSNDDQAVKDDDDKSKLEQEKIEL